MTKKVSVIHHVERVWDIDGYPNYFFGDDKHLYRYDSRGQMKCNKRIVIGIMRGYVLKSKFLSMARLRLMPPPKPI